MQYVADFFAGVLLFNCIPHMVCAMQGSAFPSPFSKPRGVGLSAPVVNFGWGFFNLLASLLLLWRCPIQIDFSPPFLAFLSGAAVLGIYASIHFGKVRRNGFK